MTTRSYSDLSDSATTFDPEEQFDRDIDERMKGMTKEEALGEYIDKLFAGYGVAVRKVTDEAIPGEPFISISEAKKLVRAAIAVADKWDAEQGAGSSPAATDHGVVCWQWRCNVGGIWGEWKDLGQSADGFKAGPWKFNLDNGTVELRALYAGACRSQPTSAISPSLDSAIQDEIDHPPASIMEEGK
jgi:hypothetical protein